MDERDKLLKLEADRKINEIIHDLEKNTGLRFYSLSWDVLPQTIGESEKKRRFYLQVHYPWQRWY